MTEQEYNLKQEELKQVRKDLEDLHQRENELRREVRKYESYEFKNKYFYDTSGGYYLKPTQLSGDYLYFTAISKFYNYDGVIEYVIEETYYSLDSMGSIKEISEEEFTNGVNQIFDDARKTIFGDDHNDF